MKKYTKILFAIASAFSAFTPIASVSAEETDQPSLFDESETHLLNSIDDDYIFNTVRYVHDNFGGRTAGGFTDQASADYFAGLFEEIGYNPFAKATSIDGTEDYFETFASDRVNARTGGVIQTDDRIYDALGPNITEGSVYFGETQESVTADTVIIENPDDAAAADAETISGKIVVTYRKPLTEWKASSAEYADTVRALEAKGAAGVIFIFPKYTVNENGKVSSSRYPLAAVTEGEEIHIPVLLTPYLEGQQILKKISSSPCCSSLTIANRKNTETSNIIAVKEAAVPTDEYVMIGAHRDSVFGAEGANDNLSGTANVLGLAKAFQNIDTDANIIFALWGAEEDGLQGSKAFYDEVIAPDGWGKEHITAYYNMDMTAPAQKRNRVLTVHTPYKDESGNPIQSPAGDTTEYNAGRLYQISEYAGTDVWSAGPEDAEDLQYFGNCSDHASISGANASPKLQYGEGIPSVYVFWGDNIGDGRNDVTEQNYHVPGDIFAWPEGEDVFTVIGDDAPFAGNYDIRRADILARVMGLSVYNTADYPDLPEDGSTIQGDFTLSVPEAWKSSIVLDGQSVTADENGTLIVPADDKEHTLTLTDRFGREDSVTFTTSLSSAADKSSLEEAVASAKSLAPEGKAVYSDASKAALDSAIEQAETVLADENASAAAIDDAAAALQEAQNNLGYNLYRVYNKNNGEHLFTADKEEYDQLKKAGWTDENIAWITPTSGKALTRLYNKNSGEHHYTADPREISHLESLGWKNEGEKWFSADKDSGLIIHRVYNPNAGNRKDTAAGAHHYTLEDQEKDYLTSQGWSWKTMTVL